MVEDAEARTRVSFPRSEVPDGSRKVVTVGKREIVVVNVSGTLRAMYNRCPHRQAPLDRGLLGRAPVRSPVGELQYGTEIQVLRCPWHRWEFDLETGSCIADPKRFRVKTYEVKVEGDEIALYV